MAKFDAGSAVEELEFDFSKFGGGAGSIDEPTTGRVNAFFTGLRTLLKEVRGLQKDTEDLDQIEELSEEEIAAQADKIDSASAGASEYQQRTMELIAELCGAKWEGDPPQEGEEDQRVLVGGSPSLEALQTLPFRHLQVFNQWLIQEIQPKRTTPGSKR